MDELYDGDNYFNHILKGGLANEWSVKSNKKQKKYKKI